MRLLYIEELRRNGYENENYRSEKLLKRLQNYPIKVHLSFMKVDHDKFYAISSWLVYSSNITFIDALAKAYTLGSTEKYENPALLLRGNIVHAFTKLTVAANIRRHGAQF